MDQQPTAWLVKVPRFLYDGWSQLSEDDLNLGTVRVYDTDHKGKQRIELILPSVGAPIPLPEYDPEVAGRNVKRIPRQYEVNLTSEATETAKRNIFAFKEKQEDLDGNGNIKGDDDIDTEDDSPDASKGGFKRRKKPKITTAFAGRITNEAAVKPILASRSEAASTLSSRGVSPAIPSSSLAGQSSTSSQDSKTGLGLGGTASNRAASFTPEYREILRQRKLAASKPKRTVMMLDDDQEGTNNMLAAGLGAGHIRGQQSSFVINNSQSSSSSAGKGKQSSQTDKFARIPKNELLDLLFAAYERYTYWTLKALREETRQPEAYLREVLSGIADQHQRGPYHGHWSLKPEYVMQRKQEEERKVKEEEASKTAAAATAEDEDDEDMEEVA